VNAPSPPLAQRDNDYLGRRPTASDGTPISVIVRRWQPHRMGSMLRFLKLEMPSGMILNDVKVMVGPKGPHWIALPAIKQTNKDGSAKLDANGKQVWTTIIEFANRAVADLFRDQVLEAIRRRHPEVLGRPSLVPTAEELPAVLKPLDEDWARRTDHV